MNFDIRRLSYKERIILELLIAQGEQYGLELVKARPFQLTQMAFTLQQMAEKGYVEWRHVKEPGDPGPPKRIFRLTLHGKRVYQAWEKARAEMPHGLSYFLGRPVKPLTS